MGQLEVRGDRTFRCIVITLVNDDQFDARCELRLFGANYRFDCAHGADSAISRCDYY
jgi:hypothetical protein